MSDNGSGGRRRSAFREQVERERELEAADEAREPEIRADGSVRRLNKGGRTWLDFFNEKNRQRPLVRGEFLGILEMLAYNRRANVGWKRLARWLTRQPGPGDMWGELASAHYRRSVLPAIALVKAQLEERAKAENARMAAAVDAKAGVQRAD